MPQLSFRSHVSIALAVFSLVIVSGCSAEASKTRAEAVTETAKASKGATIAIQPNSPADTVRVFYKNLREKRFREALFLTNLRPAIDGLTDTELKDFQVDFEALAQHVPAEIQINGEIITGDKATVTAKLPGDDLDKEEIQEISLRRENGVWVILSADEEAEKLIKKEGKNYFYALKIETHEGEAKAMLDRISKAQMAFAATNKGTFGDVAALVEKGFLPPDARSSASTGYVYTVTLNETRSKYSASAVPAEYGKSGRLSFLVTLNEKNAPVLTSKDTKGQPIAK